MDSFEKTAVEACRVAGEYLVSEFERESLDADYGPDDVKAVADRGSERRILDVLTTAYPDHGIFAEESGKQDGESDYRWVVDPLDGTNNFCSGIPYFGVAAALLHENEPILSVIHDPLHDDTYVARRGEGATLNGEPIRAESSVTSDHATIAYVIGIDVLRDEELKARGDELESNLSGYGKRIWKSWAPVLDWGLLARGKLEAVVCFHPDAVEQHAGWLLAEESDARLANEGDLFVAAANDEVFAELESLF
ncbi:myo-inositol-1(or 4)-monophosphatase [Haladaptatus litoreus]|uniref:fructose-bisphosphatase n=1 Tax=Haladaptatus litoreus TaxID=553468 RepID=A0A1N6ZYE5_9EURY|nr:inositol monophosphatase [Haladaptatus litoreus]SIR31769.1 myo-inositol-1(or 4)-monophosphatase [Haladaptatus litoreus]